MPKPLQIAHRGGAGLWPENTLEAFTKAMDLGADGIEIDVHLTRDGVPVVHHDESLKPAATRGADGQWLTRPTPLLKYLNFAELRHFDIGRLRPGSRYGARYPEQQAMDGASIPRLEDVYHLVRSHGRLDFHIYVELKTDLLDLTQSADPKNLAETVVKLTQEMGFGHRVTFVSFDWRALKHAKHLAPEIPNAFTTLPFYSIDPEDPSAAKDEPQSNNAAIRAASKAGADWYGGDDWRGQQGPDFATKMLHSMKAGGADGWFAWAGDVNEQTMATARELDLKVSCWTVDAAADMRRLIALGADAILTDRPDRLRAVLA